MRGWAVFKEGKVVSVAMDKDDLLIGFDLITLRGLEETEKALTKKGMPVVEVGITIDNNVFDFYCFSRKGELLPEAIGYSVLENDELRAAAAAAGFFSSKMKSVEKYQDEFSSEEKVTLRRYYNFVLYRFYLDKRRRTTWTRLQKEIDDLFIQHKIEIVTVKIRRDNNEPVQ